MCVQLKGLCVQLLSFKNIPKPKTVNAFQMVKIEQDGAKIKYGTKAQEAKARHVQPDNPTTRPDNTPSYEWAFAENRESEHTLHDKLFKFVTNSDKEQLIAKLQEIEDWLYEDGEDETKGVYVAKLDELKKVLHLEENVEQQKE
ncbi:heat shock 70 kDa protein 15-like protein [Tanacetum coccineum]